MYIIGITGPSGAGKTTALRVLETMGGQVYDCDAIYHEMLASDGELLGRIEAAFPGAVKDYTLDRKALGARVFADPEGLEKLTNLTQPLVKQRVMEQIRASGAAPAAGSPFPVPSRFAVIDAIGLFESGLGEECDLTVAVVAEPEIRLRRLMARDGITEDYARARISAQKPAEWYLQKLRGHKILIQGNHDGPLLENPKAMHYFEGVEKMMHVQDGNTHICLCHFPIAEWNGFYHGTWHIYGHIHAHVDATAEFMRTREHALNAGCMINNYTPASFRELVENNERFNKELGKK